MSALEKERPVAPIGQRCDSCGWAIIEDLYRKPTDYEGGKALYQWCLDPKACDDRIREQEEGPRHRGIHSGPTTDSTCDDRQCWCLGPFPEGA